MLFPMGGGVAPESPTEFALSMRKWAICLWVLQFLCMVARFAVLDFMGGICMMLVVIIGYFVPFGKPGMSQRWIICWGFICFFNAIIDLVLGIIRLMQYLNGQPVGAHSGWMGGGMSHHGAHGSDPAAPEKAPEPTPMEAYMLKVALLAVIVALLIPLVEFLTAWLCYALFKDHKENAGDTESQSGFYGGQTYNDFNYGSSQYGGGGGSVYRQGAGGNLNRAGGGGGQSFQAFQGGGQRLGGH